MPRLSRLLDDLGPGLLRIVAGSPERPVDGMTILDPVEQEPAVAGRVVLGVGLTAAGVAEQAMAGLGGAAAVLLKPPIATDPAVTAAAGAVGVTVVEVGRGVAWEQLLLVLRRVLEPVTGPGDDDAPTDLFRLANEISALVDAPVTIEDPAFRVLAFSGGQEDTDDGRIRTVLGRRVPEMYRQRLTESGVVGELAASGDPVFVPSVFPGDRPRIAIAARAGRTVLGSLWAVVPGPLSDERRRAFRAAAELVALALLRERTAASAGSRLRAGFLTTLLTGDGDVEDAARRLDLAGVAVCVVAAELAVPADRAGQQDRAGQPGRAGQQDRAGQPGRAGRPDRGQPDGGHPDRAGQSDRADRAAELHRVSDALALHLRLVHRATAVVTLDESVYGLLPTEDDAAALRSLEEFVERSGSRTPLRCAVGRVVGDAAAIAVSRGDADDVLCLLRHGGGTTGSARTLRTDLMILRLAAGEQSLPAGSVVEVLRRHDTERGTQHVRTLAAYLDAFGDVRRAAAALHVHPNTFRYRLSRLAEAGGADLDDPDVRLGAVIDLRILRLQGR